MSELLCVENLNARFRTKRGCVYAVNGVSFAVNKSETLGIVGESGSGKSAAVMSLLRLLPSPPCEITSGKALFCGEDLLSMSAHDLRGIRGRRISVIFQDPMTSFNPVLTIGYQISEPLRVHFNMCAFEAEKKTEALLALVGIPNPRARMKNFPHQFSGGMRQRAMIAMALACNPELLIADEPTTALDVTIQAQIVELIKQLRDELKMGVIWITHDLGVIAGLAHRVMVMYGGTVVEDAPVHEIYSSPLHPYTIGLLGSLPRIDKSGGTLYSIDGMPEVISRELNFCPFFPRCNQRINEKCGRERPLLRGGEHKVACWRITDEK